MSQTDPPPLPSSPGPAPARFTRFAGLTAALAIAVLLVATGPSLAIVWDEGFTLGREERVRQWIRALRDPARLAATWPAPTPLERMIPTDDELPPRLDQVDTRDDLWRPPALTWFWPFARAEPHGHPPFYALVGLLRDLIAPAWDVLPGARLGPMLIFSIAGGAVVGFFAGRHGIWSALAAGAAWALSPRLFAHAHYALYDAILTSLWVSAVLAFARAVEPSAGGGQGGSRPRWGWVVVFGVLCGAAAGTKLTGWFLPLPFLVWTSLQRDRRGLITLIAGGFVGALVLWAVVPPWWTDPVGGVETFLRSNLSRARTTRIPTLFLGHVYVTPQSSLPWYNTIVWTVFVTPVLMLGLAGAGIGRALRHARSHPFGTLVLLNWVFLMVLRALPSAPGHDGIRQFLPAFGLLALLVGLGAASMLERWPRAGRWYVGAAAAEAALSVALMMPVPLAYYSPLVGGPAGANRLGMEPTYYWDSLTSSARVWLNEHTPPGRTVLFSNNPTAFQYLHLTGQLTFPLISNRPTSSEPAWYVVQNRAGMLDETQRRLIARLGPRCVLVSKFGTPLLWAFPFEAFLEETQRSSSASGPGP